MAKRKTKAKAQSPALAQLRAAVAKSQGASVPPGDEFEQNTHAAVASAAALALHERMLDSVPTDAQALDFAKLLRAGVPQLDALAYCVGVSVEPALADIVLRRWLQCGNVRDALAAINGGAWPTLTDDARMDTALNKHYAELAHYLYTHDYDGADGIALKKIEFARAALESQRTGRMEQQSPFAKFLNSLLKGDVAVLKQEGPLRKALGDGERPSTLGLADIEPEIADAMVAEVVDEE